MDNIVQPIALITSPFTDKFSIPRQPGLAPSVISTVSFVGDFDHAASIEGIQQYSHLWLIFEFNQHRSHQWRERVRPPRLGGNKQLGVFATRSPFRPNNLGMSVVKLVDVVVKPQVKLVVSGADLLDQTPIVDIKPYVPYVDAIPEASSAFAGDEPNQLEVCFSATAEAFIDELTSNAAKSEHYQNLRQVIIEVLRQDPRPAYHASKQPERHYVSQLYELELNWYVTGQCLTITEIRQQKDF